jgi:hypothetical protein
MAVGDAAASHGFDVVPTTRQHSTGANDINLTRDYIAGEQDARTAADALKLDAAKLQVSPTAPPVVAGGLWARPIT